jgi:hypothetical protein
MIWSTLGRDGQRWVKGAAGLMVGACVIASISPITSTRSELGELGSFVGGLTTPFVGLLTITLLFVTFKKQSQSTRIQYLALQEERRQRRRDDASRIIDDGIRRLEGVLERACYIQREDNGYKVSHRGIDAIYRFCVDCGRSGAVPYMENEVLADTITHWLFEGDQLLRRVRQASPEELPNLVDRLRPLYAFSIEKSLNTLLMRTGSEGAFSEALSRIRVAKMDFDAALGGHFDGAPLV